VLERCFAEITRQLEARGLMLKKGTLMDATIVASTHNPRKLKGEKGANHPKEPGAGWINKAGKSYFGYKLHIGVDQGSGLIRKAIFTTAHCQDSEVADGLISGEEKAVYADRAYENKHRGATLKANGIKDRIMHRRHKHLPVLPTWQKKRNALISKRRAPVEAVFGALKNVYGKGRARCYSLLVNAADYFTSAAIYNLRRAVIMTS
jgi:transposase, IS5 family